MTPQRKAELLLFLSTFIWGSTFVIVKGTLESVTPYLFVVLRFGVATLILSALFPGKFRTFTVRSMMKGGILAVFLFAGFMLQNFGLMITTASKSAFFTGMLVVFTPIVQFVWEKRMPTLGNLIGVLLSAIGLLLLTSPTDASFNVGDAMTLLCAFLFAIYIVYLDIASATTDRYHLLYGQVIITAVFGLIGMAFFEQPYIEWSMENIYAIAYLTIFATLLTTYVQTRYQGDTTPTRAAVIFTTEPVIAASLAYFFRNEVLGVAGIIGGAVIIMGLLVSEMSGESRLLGKTILTKEPTAP